MLQPRKPNCDGCPLAAQPKVFGRGPLTARVLLVAEAPGPQEERQGEPLVGPTGWRTAALLRGAGLSIDDVRIENAMQCKAKPQSAAGTKALEHCGPSLQDVIAAMPNLEAIFAFGEAALREVSGRRASELAAKRHAAEYKRAAKAHAAAERKRAKQLVSWSKKQAKWQAALLKWEAAAARMAARGRTPKRAAPVPPTPVAEAAPPMHPFSPLAISGWTGVAKQRGSALKHTLANGRTVWLFPLLHPAATFAHRSPDLLPLLALDVRKAARVWRGELPVPRIAGRTCTTALDLVDWFTDLPAGRVALDIEWSRTMGELVCIGIGAAEHYALIPFVTKEGWRLGLAQRADIMAALQLAFDNPQWQWGGHFVVGYDERKLHEVGLRLTATWDSLYAFHIVLADMGSQRDEQAVEQTGNSGGKVGGYDLGFVSTVLTPLPYHKGVVTHERDALDAETAALHSYCIGDVARSWYAMEAMAPDLAGQGWRLLERDIATARRATAMGLAGIPIVEAERGAALAIAVGSISSTQGSVNVRSTLQLAKALEATGITVRWNRRTGKPKLNGKVLNRLMEAHPTNELLQQAQRLRAAQKEVDAYTALEPDARGLAHPSWKVHGTSGPRWSSTPNFQNLSHEQRKVIG